MASRPRIAPSLAPRDALLESPPPEAPAVESGSAWRWLKYVLFFVVLVLFLAALTPPAVVFWLRSHAPPTTAFMLQSDVQPVRYHWIPARQIPESLRLAVIASEDQKFRTHWGFDFYAIAEALEHNEKSNRKRGASTITQQTAKNLFLWPSRSWLRKGLEVTFTLLLEGELSKDRILEIYLNVVEFGPGIYGAEAAAERFFGKTAANLTPAECAQLAAVLPNPRKWHADRPGPYVQSRVDWILGQIGERPRFSTTVPAGEEPEEPQGDAEGSDENAAPAAPDETPADQDAGEPAAGAPTDEVPPPADTAPEESPAEPSTPGPPAQRQREPPRY